MQQPTRRGPLGVAPAPVSGSDERPDPSDDVQAVLTLVARASGADQLAVGTMQTAILLLQEAVATLRAAADARDVLTRQVPLPLLREALARRATAPGMPGQR